MESAEQQQQQQQQKQPLKKPHLPTPAQRDDWRIKTVLVDLATCLLAAILVSFSLFYFSNYNNFAPGGVTGLASIVGNFLYNTFNIGEVSLNMGILMFAFNAPIFILFAVFVSRKTGFILIAYMLMQSGLMMLFQWLKDSVGLPFYDAVSAISPKENNVVFAAIGVGVVSGLGFSLMLRRFGASGGTYAISALIKHFHPEHNIAWVAFALDSSIVGLAFFAYDFQINPVISSLLNIFLSNLVVDYMLQGLRSGYKFEIITDKPEELSTEIMAKLGRGVTTLHAQGMYTHKEHTLVVCIIRKRQVGELLKILKEYDATFSYSCKVNEVYGRFKK